MSIFNHFQQLNLTTDQETALQKIEAFLSSPFKVFLLKGYAGSGKTTILKGLVEYLDTREVKFSLMAPTGRAAKVIRDKTGQEANTIHKSIYSYDEMVEVKDGESFFYNYKIRNNDDIANTIFIVDEASMVSDCKSEGEFFRFGTSHLLTDLISYSRITSPTANTKVIFVGDPCQLPPVGDNSSKAFDREYLKVKFHLDSEETEMKEVKRQTGQSKIFDSSSRIRKSITSGYFNNFHLYNDGSELIKVERGEFLNKWEAASAPKIIIAAKNKTCQDLNMEIRERRFGNRNLPIQKGDIVILGANNYRKGVFNGEFAVVNEISLDVESRTIALRGQQPVTLSWRNVQLIFPDSLETHKIVKGTLLENFLHGDNNLRPEEWQALYVDFTTRHKGVKPGTDQFKDAIKNDEYFNCLLMKYGYAVTCHKAQGGEWDNVFTVWDHDNQPHFDYFTNQQLRKGKDNVTFFRWAYTAITRASKSLYLINAPSFSAYSSMSFIGPDVLTALTGLTGREIKSEEVELNDDLLKELRKFGLLDEPMELQDHFIQVRHAVRKSYIEIRQWRRKNFEIIYEFNRENRTAGLKTWINRKNKFNGSFQEQPALTTCKSLLKEVDLAVRSLPSIVIKRNTADTILTKLEFDNRIEEQFPFTKDLFDDLNVLFENTDILIDNVDHLQFKERYTFKRNIEIAAIDFEYNLAGVFGRVLVVGNDTNKALASDVMIKVQRLKTTENAS